MSRAESHGDSTTKQLKMFIHFFTLLSGDDGESVMKASNNKHVLFALLYTVIFVLKFLIYFQATVPRRYRERGKSAGQPMRSHTLTSRCLPLIYINTSVIRVFCPTAQDKHSASG